METRMTMKMAGRLRSLLCVIAAIGCTSASADQDADPPDGLPSSDASIATDATNADATNADVGESSHIEGTVAGAAFTRAVRAWWIGRADSPSSTVVYVFDADVGCDALSAPGWDTRIANGTQVLEMKLLGSALQTYPVVGGPLPGPGEASVNHTLSQQRGAPTERVANGGSVTLAAQRAGVSSTGSFDLTFPAGGALRGSFDAAWCPTGHEP
jgi:hypothetical protein